MGVAKKSSFFCLLFPFELTSQLKHWMTTAVSLEKDLITTCV